MIQSDKINKIVAVAVVFALIVSVAFVGIANYQAENGGFETEPEYATKIFGEDIISIDIIVDEDDWQEMLDNAMNEEFIMADVIVNGTKFRNVGIRPKGNSSLTQVASSDSNRYSFRLQFDEYVKGQTCFGLESFVVNNMLGDNTYMKEYISYDLMREAGVDAPYFGFANIKVNGENWGLYLAVELYNDSYEQRVFGDTSGMLYNVKSMDMGGNRGQNQQGKEGENIPTMPDMQNGMPQMMFNGQFRQNFNFQRDSQGSEDGQPFALPDGNTVPDFKSIPDAGNSNFPGQNFPWQRSQEQNTEGQNMPAQSFPGQDSQGQNTEEQNVSFPNFPWQNFPAMNFPGQMNGENRGMDRNFGGRGRFGSSGGSLEYIDDDTGSYSAIFGNVVGKGTENDFKRVVKALKALSEGKDLEKYFDVDKILRYLAAHTIVVNLDSYSSSMAQNYYIYERNGKITILPWDYNLAWGGFRNGNASSVINFPIDTPVSGVEMSERPLIDKLFANPEYLERYHSYLQQLIDNYFADGKFEEKVKELDALISDYVKNDATAFCTYEEYKTAVSTFITLGNLRAQSVQGQLDGTIPSTSEEQNANPSKLVSAGNLNLSDLGSMMGGRGGNIINFPAEMLANQFSRIQQNDEQVNSPGNIGRVIQRRQEGQEVQGGQEVQAGQDTLGGQEVQTGQRAQAGQRAQVGQEGQAGRGTQAGQQAQEGQEIRQGRQDVSVFRTFDARFQSAQRQITNDLVYAGVLIFVLIAAIVFAARFKRSY